MKKASSKSLSLKNSFVVFSVIAAFFAFLFVGKSFFKNILLESQRKPNVLMMLIEFEQIEGILQWEKELDARNFKAMIKAQDNVLKEYPLVFKRLADKGYEIAGGYDVSPFWDMAYEEQYNFLKESKDLVEQVTGKQMRVFGSRYFAYDENTLKAADALGVEYILARGTQDVEAVIYKPEEYKVKIISVTNVDVGEEMGRGSLCDYSLWARGSGPEDFGKTVKESLARKPRSLILVSHAYLGGTRRDWWKEYQKVLDSEEVDWEDFDQWVARQEVLILPNKNIPVNREVKYVEPRPEKTIDEYEAIAGLENLEPSVCPDSSGLPMCQ